MKPASKKHLMPIVCTFLVALAVTFALYWENRKHAVVLLPTSKDVFATQFPNNTEYVSEILLLKAQGKLQEENENKIRNSVEKAGSLLSIPNSLLYCLFFQESRLDHLHGLNSNESALGLGQFSYYSFFEVNNQLSTYTKNNLKAMQKMLGYDVRPIEAKASDLFHPSSYYHIPTAVTASAIYLNNRYLHLTKLINSRQILYDKNLLWFLAAMAYNKGTRSILSLWNETEAKRGPEGLKEFLSEPKTFFSTLNDSLHLTNSLKRIWAKQDASAYAKEWQIHASNIAKCSVDLESAEKGSN